MPVTETEVRKGLAGVYADTTAISMVNPATNSLTYRGYPVQELARKCSFGEVAYLLWHQRWRHGLGAVPPRDDLGFAANFLPMTFGQVPEPAVVSAFETALILYAEDGFSASTFTARIVTSTLSDLYSAVTAAIGALKGPLHGANEAVMRMLDEIAIPDNAGPWLDEALADKRRVMGFGHRVYRNGDARVPAMRDALAQIAAFRGGQDLLGTYESLARAVFDATGLHPNLDYPAGAACHLIGFDAPAFTPVFAAARLPGWTAHIAEQLAANSLIHPLAAYDGPAERHVPQG
jgi:citrate synthase